MNASEALWDTSCLRSNRTSKSFVADGNIILAPDCKSWKMENWSGCPAMCPERIQYKSRFLLLYKSHLHSRGISKCFAFQHIQGVTNPACFCLWFELCELCSSIRSVWQIQSFCWTPHNRKHGCGDVHTFQPLIHLLFFSLSHGSH